MSIDEEALEYHASGRPGKIEVVPSKPVDTERALSLAYTPGVAAACREIAKDVSKVFDYTARGNLVAVVTNGTAVLGLGNIGPEASKPVMEGKGVLFKKFADIDVFDIELKNTTIEEFIISVKCLEPTFGGINLEDIKSPDCFIIEERLQKEMKIPVFHDDQHGTAIIASAALMNACQVTHRKMEEVIIVMNGAGAAALASAKLFLSLGVKKQNIIMCDSHGIVYTGRTVDMNPYKDEFALDTKKRTLTEALTDADAFVGLSVANCVTKTMIKGMAKNPIIFAMANPVPEIMPEDIREARPDAIIATGRSDYPNQINNALAYPGIFKGALDCRARCINEVMKQAAAQALAGLILPAERRPGYIIPSVFDPRVVPAVAQAVAQAARETGVARLP